MARARNIKPGFFKNEDLAECSPWARLCFIGLWTMADREGRLEDRPKKIKGELFAFDSVEVEPLLAELERWKFIRRYQVGSDRFIFILKFAEHQTPHGTEKDSVIPDESGVLTVNERAKNGYITGKSRRVAYGDNDALTVKGGDPGGGENTLIPDSGFLNPSSGANTGPDDPGGEDVAEPVGTRAGRLCKRIRQEAKFMGATPSNPELLALLNAGYTDDEIFDSCVDAAGRGIQAFGWVSKAVQSSRDKASRVKPAKTETQEAKPWEGAI